MLNTVLAWMGAVAVVGALLGALSHRRQRFVIRDLREKLEEAEWREARQIRARREVETMHHDIVRICSRCRRFKRTRAGDPIGAFCGRCGGCMDVVLTPHSVLAASGPQDGQKTSKGTGFDGGGHEAASWASGGHSSGDHAGDSAAGAFPILRLTRSHRSHTVGKSGAASAPGRGKCRTSNAPKPL